MMSVWPLRVLMTISFLVLNVAFVFAANKIIYGIDNRMEIDDSPSHVHHLVGRATAAQISQEYLVLTKAGYLLKSRKLKDQINLCKDQSYRDQLSVANCSGFLVNEDTLITAGHCMRTKSKCSDYNWVFDYKIGEIKNGYLKRSSVYKCIKIKSWVLNHKTREDFAVIKLDRRVLDRQSLRVRRRGKIKKGTGLFVVGYPSGVPQKVAGGAIVVINKPDEVYPQL